MLPLLHGLVGLGRQRLDPHHVELVAPQVLERHGVVVLDVEPRHFVHFGVDARILPLHVGVIVVVLELAQRLLRLDVVGALRVGVPKRIEVCLIVGARGSTRSVRSRCT